MGTFPPADQPGPGRERGQQDRVDQVGQLGQFRASRRFPSPYYRCTASRDYIRQHQISHPAALYLREDAITTPIDRFLRTELTGKTLTDNLRRVADAQSGRARRPRHHRRDRQTPPGHH
jgi:hypothetical protein